MAKNDDPFRQRPNPEIRDTLKVIRGHWRDFIAEKDFTCRRS